MTPAAGVFLALAAVLAGTLGVVLRRLRQAREALAVAHARREPTGMPRPSSRPPPPLVTMAVLALVASCHDTQAVVTAANAQREVGVVAAKILHDVCTVGYERAETQEEIDRLDALGCTKAAHALRTYRQAHAVEVSVLLAFEAGRCTSLVNQAPRECDLATAALAVERAAQELAVTIGDLGATR